MKKLWPLDAGFCAIGVPLLAPVSRILESGIQILGDSFVLETPLLWETPLYSSCLKGVPGPQKYVNYKPFGLLLEVLGTWFTCF